MRAVWAVLLGVALASCGEGEDDAERELRDAQTVAAVKRANDTAPRLVEVVPEPILLPDIERFDMFGQACSYAPGTSLGARVIAREADAFMKIDDEVVRFAADPGARELPMRTSSLYNGRAYSLRLDTDIPVNDPEQPSGTFRGEGTIWLRDEWGRVVYQGSGAVECRP